MNVRAVTPLSIERDFKINEMFFSTTTEKGVIVTGNEVFTRISGFLAEELVGKPHNIIRHPDMPRAAFYTVWKNLKAGKPFSGYVKNMAKDGACYWVFAVITPISGKRYLSVRFKPTSEIFAAIPKAYAKILSAENHALADGKSEKEATEAGVAVLNEIIAQLGYENYDVFADAALNAEMKSRDKRLVATGEVIFPAEIISAKGSNQDLSALYATSIGLYDRVNKLFGGLDRFAAMNRDLHEKAKAVISVADEFRLAALNANITSVRFGADGACISVISEFMSDYARSLNVEVDKMRQHLDETAEAIEAVNANISMSRLQLEMLLFYQAELSHGAEEENTNEMLLSLEDGFVASTSKATAALQELTRHVAPLTASRDLLIQSLTSVQVAQVRGLTEVARIPSSDGLRTLFEEFRGRAAKTRTDVNALSEVLDGLRQIILAMPREMNLISQQAAAVQERLRSAIA